MNQEQPKSALETLVSARDALKALSESRYLPFSSPSPCGNEVNIKISVRIAIENLDNAIAFHKNQFGNK